MCPSSPGCLAVPVGFAGGGLYATSEHLSPGRGVRSGACSRSLPRMAQSCICRLAASSSAQRQWRSLGARFITLHARCAGLHDLDVALPGRLRRGCSARPPPPLASRAQQPTAGRYASAARMAARAFISPTAFEQARGRRSGSGRWQGRVRRGRSLRSRPRNSVHRSVG